MNSRFFLMIYPVLFLCIGCASPLQIEQKAAAVPFAERWLRYLDSAEQDLAWREVSSLGRLRYQEDTQLKLWFGAREPLGRVLKRRLIINWSIEADFVPSVPDGTYWELSFLTDFEQRNRVDERILLVWEDGQWQLLAFTLR